MVASRAGAPVVRETPCKSILNRSGIGDYSLNCYTGCTHACVYCYARFMQRFHPHEESWGDFVDVKSNAVEVLARQLRRAQPGSVFVSSACDGWQPEEAKRQLTRECCRLLVAHNFQVNILTKSALVLRDLDILADSPARVGVTVTTPDPHLQRLWEPRCATVEQRWQVLAEAKATDLRTSVMFGPLLPFLSDSLEVLLEMMTRAGDLGVDSIWVDQLNPRPRVWPAVQELLRREFPDLLWPYRKVLFDKSSRQAYIAQLRRRVRAASEKLKLTDRVSGCT
ncbi:MAG: radical SAM protein [Armatimonadetes bacterium]|nr:radical SAM protein [Armatimonadota bacterium]